MTRIEEGATPSHAYIVDESSEANILGARATYALHYAPLLRYTSTVLKPSEYRAELQ